MNQTREIIVSDAEGTLKEEIEKLQAVLAGLTAERDDLRYHICPELEARYAQEIGDRSARINYQKILILELKRRIEIARAALNREQTVSQQDVDDEIHREYGQFHDKVNEEFKKAEQAKREQKEREEQRKRYEEEWRKRYGSAHGGGNADDGSGGTSSGEEGGFGSDGSYTDKGNKDTDEKSSGNGGDRTSGNNDTGTGTRNHDDSGSGGTRNEVPDIKKLYRKIMKRLHPDENMHATEWEAKREKELMLKAMTAYKNGDVVTLQEIYDELFSDGAGAAGETEKKLSYEELVELKKKLTERIEKLRAEIEDIKKNFPYREKGFLADPDAVKERQGALDEEIRRNEETIKRLTALLEEINQEMEELRKKQK